ncbi:hypothetical protein A2U01_0071348, partial [Trifolium medium]|nr:hypothetical protein [Trifolium medium]
MDLSLLSLSNGSTSCVAESTTIEDEALVDASFPSFNPEKWKQNSIIAEKENITNLALKSPDVNTTPAPPLPQKPPDISFEQ